MLCPACGVEVPKEALFCHKCGQRLVEQEAQSEQVPQETKAETLRPEDKFKPAVTTLEVGDEQERELWSGGYSPKAMIGAWCLSALISFVLLIIGIVWVRDA